MITRSFVLAISFSAFVFAQNATFGNGSTGEKKTKEERREEATTRTATGVVTGADDAPVSGAIVQVKDMKTLAVRSFITQADGVYHFYGLKNDTDYELSAKSGELRTPTRRLSIFDARKEAIMNFKFDKAEKTAEKGDKADNGAKK
jgi:hypothetical protein